MSEQEIWKDVVGYEDIYQVSNFGRIKRVAKAKGAIPGHILKLQCNRNGYLVVHLNWRNNRKAFEVHCLVAQAFLCCPSSNHQVNHKNGVRTDNRVENLEWVTRSENALHAYRVLGVKPERANGQDASAAKLTNKDVLQIRNLYSTGNYTQKELGQRFCVNQSTVSSIVRGATWVHIPCSPLPIVKKLQHGENKSGAKLTNQQVIEIRRLYATGHYTHRGLGQQFGVSHATIDAIVNMKKWRHL